MQKEHKKNVPSSYASRLSEWKTHDRQYNTDPTFITYVNLRFIYQKPGLIINIYALFNVILFSRLQIGEINYFILLYVLIYLLSFYRRNHPTV
jgi:hypothetical protein